MMIIMLPCKAKPNGQYEVKSNQIEEFMSNVSVLDLPGVGWKLGKKMKEKGFQSCFDLWKLPNSILIV